MFSFIYVPLIIVSVIWFALNLFSLVILSDEHYFELKEYWDNVKNRSITTNSKILGTSGWNAKRYMRCEIGGKEYVHFEDGNIKLNGRYYTQMTPFFKYFGVIMVFKYRKLYKEIIRKFEPHILEALINDPEDTEEYKSFKK